MAKTKYFRDDNAKRHYFVPLWIKCKIILRIILNWIHVQKRYWGTFCHESMEHYIKCIFELFLYKCYCKKICCYIWCFALKECYFFHYWILRSFQEEIEATNWCQNSYVFFNDILHRIRQQQYSCDTIAFFWQLIKVIHAIFTDTSIPIFYVHLKT